MLLCFSGRNGSGKTKCAVDYLFGEWLYGSDIATATPLYFERFAKNPLILWLLRRKFNPGNIYHYNDLDDVAHLKNAIVFMDEASEFIDSRHWENLPSWFSSKLRQHRKDGFDVVFTTQNFKTIDVNARRLVQEWYLMTRIFGIGDGKLMKLFIPRGRLLLGMFWKFKKDVYDYSDAVDETEVKNLYRHLKLIWWYTPKKYSTLQKVARETMLMIVNLNWLVKDQKIYETISGKMIPYDTTLLEKSDFKSAFQSLLKLAK